MGFGERISRSSKPISDRNKGIERGLAGRLRDDEIGRASTHGLARQHFEVRVQFAEANGDRNSA